MTVGMVGASYLLSEQTLFSKSTLGRQQGLVR